MGALRNSLRRLARVLLVLFGASVLVFLLTGNIAGSAAAEAVSSTGADITKESLAAMEALLGLDQPLYLRYLRWLRNVVFYGDFGTSYITGEPVLKELACRVSATAELTLYAFALTLIVSIPSGILMAIRNRKPDENLAQAISFSFMGIPTFVLGLLLAYVVSVRLKWVKMIGFDTPALKILPTITLSIPMICKYSRMIKANVLTSMNEDYVHLLRTRGIRERVILFQNVLKDAFLPIISILGLGIGHMLGGAVVVENIFSIPGLGSFLSLSISRRDYPVIQAYILLMTAVFLLINFAADTVTVLLDPRIRLKGTMKG